MGIRALARGEALPYRAILDLTPCRPCWHASIAGEERGLGYVQSGLTGDLTCSVLIVFAADVYQDVDCADTS